MLTWHAIADMACHWCTQGVVDVLLAHGADATLKDLFGLTAAQLARENHFFAVAFALELAQASASVENRPTKE